MTDEAGKPVTQIQDEDVCIYFNYRADRARQITRVLTRNSGLTKLDGRDLDPGSRSTRRFRAPRFLRISTMSA